MAELDAAARRHPGRRGASSSSSSGANLAIMGSGELIGSLMAADLIDEYLLMIHPLVLGTGRRLFAERRARVAAAHRQRHHDHGRADRHLRAGERLDVNEPHRPGFGEDSHYVPGRGALSRKKGVQ